MSWLMSLLAALVLIEAGAAQCPMGDAHAAQEVMAEATEHPCDTADAVDGVMEHASMALGGDVSVEAGHACGSACDGGAGCGDCVMLSSLGHKPDSLAKAPYGDLRRTFTAHNAPQRTLNTDPPPPKL